MEKEIKAYLIDPSDEACEDVGIGDWNALSDEKWIELSESQGKVYSLNGFSYAFNMEGIPFDTYLRFIKN